MKKRVFILCIISFLSLITSKSSNLHAANCNLVFQEDFENGTLGKFFSDQNDLISLTSLPAYPIRSGSQINGAYSAKITYRNSGSYWYNCMSAPYSFGAKTYTIALRYKIENIAEGAFFTIKIAHKTNGMLNRGVGIDNSGIVSNHKINIINAKVTAEEGTNYNRLVLTLDATDEYNLIQFSSNGECSYIVDDIKMYEGVESNPVFEDISKKDVNVKLIGSSDYENKKDGCMTFYADNDKVGTSFVSSMDSKINGYYSKSLYSSNLWSTEYCTNEDLLESNKVYTLAFRYKPIEMNGCEFTDNSLIIAGLKCKEATSLQKYIAFTKDGNVSYFRKEGENYYPWLNGIIFTNIIKNGDYYDAEIVFNTDNEDGYTFRLGFYDKGAIILDDIRLYEGNGSIAACDIEKKELSDYPSVQLRGLRPTSGWVGIPVALPRVATNNATKKYVVITNPNNEKETLEYSASMDFIPTMSGLYTITYVVENATGFKVDTSFELTILPEPNVPTMTLTDEQKEKCNGYINEMVTVPSPTITDDKDDDAEVYVTGPNGFKSNSKTFLVTYPGTYTVTYTAENAKGETSTLSFTFERTNKSTYFDNRVDYEESIGNEFSSNKNGCNSSISPLLCFTLLLLTINSKRRNKNEK